jgi:hypothetical protein
MSAQQPDIRPTDTSGHGPSSQSGTECQVRRQAPTSLVWEPDLADGSIRQERIPELRRESVAFPEIGRWKAPSLGGDHSERLRPGSWRLDKAFRNPMGPASGERRLGGARELFGFNGLGGNDDDKIDQVPDARVLMATRERVGVQLLGKVVSDGIGWKLDRSHPGELEQIRSMKEIWRIDECVSTRKVDVERCKLQTGYACDDSDAYRSAGRALHLLDDFAKLE